MGLALAEIGPGLAQPVPGAQRSFRALLQAMARPGRLQALPEDVMRRLAPPTLQPATAALLLTLLDADTSVHLGGRLQQEAALRYLGFHTGTRSADVAEADFAVFSAGDTNPVLWDQLRDGTDLVPQSGATLIVEVPALGEAAAGCSLLLRGPGIRASQRLSVGGLDRDFWRARIARQADFPRGIDLVLVCGTQLAALPRTTQITLED